jgi:membrane protease YdiL (CAAX protease family)
MTVTSGHPNQAPSNRREDSPDWLRRHPLLGYVLVAYGISWTLLIGGFFGSQAGIFNPDGSLIGVMIQIAAAGPLIAALVILALTRGRSGLAALGRSIIRWRINPLWYAFAFLAVPLLMITAVTAFYSGAMVPALTANWSLLYTALPLQILGVALITGLAEEPGWRGYAQPTANRNYAPLTAALIVSVIWAFWHLPNILFGQTVTQTLTHLLATVVNGFVLAWAYNSTSSVLLVMLLHGAQNATANVIQQLLDGSTGGPSTSTYYLISAMTFGVLMTLVVALTRGRLGIALAQHQDLETPSGDSGGPSTVRRPEQEN